MGLSTSTAGSAALAGTGRAPEGGARLIVILAALAAFGPLSIDMYLPALPEIAAALGVDTGKIQSTIGVFLAGFGVGMLFYGPLSDRYGRRRLLLGGVTLYVIASIGCLLAVSAGQLIGWRLLQALGGAGASVLARAVVRDAFPIGKAATVLSWMHMITMVATLMAPLLGSLLLSVLGWRAVFGALALLAAAVWLAVWLGVPETLPPRERKDSVLAAFKSYGAILRRSRALACILAMGFTFGGMFAYITASPFVYIEYFGLSPRSYAWLFSLNIAGVMVMTYANTRLLKRRQPRQLLRLGGSIAALAGAALLLACSVGGVTGLPWIVLAMLAFFSVTGMMGANALACLLAWYPQQAGAATGLAVALQFGLGAVFNALVAWLHDGTPLAMGIGVCSAGMVACVSAWWAGRPG
ncbi:Bcr/CflA family multidrug efflux MFS transporter [Kerstersia sp.]|uniref:Bcr/CflA family multidrug efflux MFS transporter n=1 Tax=Kerstersia sp. TaxID=1930783 RepID=UPI003F8E7D7F